MTISVSQLNNYIHGMLDIDGVLNDVSVCGEITNLKKAREGWYFSLKDENSAIDCFCYNSDNIPEIGSVVVADGKINFWVKSGRISFFVRRFSAVKNTGAAYQKFVELRDRLAKEGLFDESRKKVVPQCCLKIGVVTSATGAVIHDIENVSHRRQPFSDIVLYPVKVQGEGADIEIAQGILYLSQTDVDVIIVGRGGGSNEDLSAFNSEVVVRAVSVCEKPIVSAVGHGVDFTLCDFAADKRAVTPSEAAEFVTLDSAQVKKEIVLLLKRLSSTVQRQVENCRKSEIFAIRSISSGVSSKITAEKTRVVFCLKNSLNTIRKRVETSRLRTENITTRLSAANPANILRRGFAYVEKNGKKVGSVSQTEIGDILNITLADGKINASVEGKSN